MDTDSHFVPSGKVGVIMVSFGEPRTTEVAEVEDYLVRIFLGNAALEGGDASAPEARARQLAARRAPGLLASYVEIGGSPLNAQAEAQSAAVRQCLVERGWNVEVYTAFQFTAPTIANVVRRAMADQIDILIAFPVYPICGRSTTVASVRDLLAAVADLEWRVRQVSLTGWHHHEAYVRMRADHVRDFVRSHGLDLNAADTQLHFSAHGTPVKYLDEGNRYDRYVDEHCHQIARLLGAGRYSVGFQNHTNRGIAWTQPDNQVLIPAVDAERLIVVPISFMHEQSETLYELDVELKAFAEDLGKEWLRVPVPHDDARFPGLVADLLRDLMLVQSRAPRLAPCSCANSPDVWCTNGARNLPPSPFIPS